MLHYNFPPFSVGETGFMGSPKRREIGHGNLARRGIKAVMPDLEAFPYVLRVVSEVARVERLELDGLGLRHQPVADGRGRSDQGAGRRRRDGPGEGRRAVRGPDRHPGRRGPPRRHGFQGRGHRDGRHRTADGHQDQRHHARDHEGRPGTGESRAPAHPRRDEQGARQAARGDVRVGADHRHDQDRPRKDPRRDRQGRFGDPHRSPRRPARRSTSRTTARSRSRRSMAHPAARRCGGSK